MINALLMGLLALVSPFYIAWRMLIRFFSGISERAAAMLGLVLLALVTTGVYWKHFDNAFQFDDFHTIVENSHIRDLSSIPGFFASAEMGSSLPTNQSYRPVIASLNTIDYWLADGLDTRVFHWHIFIEFLVILALVYVLSTYLFQMANGEPNRLPALLVTAFFALHTATAETINYIIARSDVFSTLMVLVAMLVFMKASGWRRHLALVPFIVGCFAKPTALMFAPLLAMYLFLVVKPGGLVRDEQPAFGIAIKRAVASSAIYFLVGAALYFFTRSMYSDAWTPGGNYSGWEYLVTQSWVIWIYVKTFLLPTGLTADTDLEVIRNVFSARVLWGLAVILTLLTIAFLSARKRITLPIAFGILWFFIALVPSSSIIPLAEVMNHHRTFFPYIGLTIASVWALYLVCERLLRTSQSSWPALGVTTLVALILGAHAWGTMHRVEVWHSNETLWQDVTIKSPDNGRGLMNYGLALMQRGDIEGALDYYERALPTNYGSHPYLYINLGIATNVLANRGNSTELREKAEGYFSNAVRMGPGFPQTHYRYAAWLHEQGRDEEALGHVNRSLAMLPEDTSALALKARLTQGVGERLEAESAAAEAANTPAAFINLSLSMYNAGNYEDAIQAAQRAADLDPAKPLRMEQHLLRP